MKTKDKPHCCEMTCGQDAEYGIWPVPAENYEDTTETCARHIGDLLGTTGTQKVEHYVIYPL